MSINPLVGDDKVPVLYLGEVLFIRRSNIRLVAKIGGCSIQSDGVLFCTSLRLCFVADKPTEQFKSLEIPLMLVRGERFNQPLFGSNNLSMNVASTNGWGNANEFSVKFEFRKGGAQTFLRIFWRVMSSVNDTRNIPVAQAVPEAVRDVASGNFVRSAFIDPSDPSYLYTSQPYQPTYNLPTNYPVPVYYAQQVPTYVDLPQQIPQATPVQPVQPVQVSPVQPVQVTPVQPVQVTPVQPVQPVQVTPVQPVQPPSTPQQPYGYPPQQSPYPPQQSPYGYPPQQQPPYPPPQQPYGYPPSPATPQQYPYGQPPTGYV